MKEIEIELAGCEVDEQLLIGFMAVSAASPADFRGSRRDGDRLILEFDALPEEGPFTEVLRVLGGSAKGEAPMRVIAPEQYAGRTAVPSEHKGGRRWDCPRCGGAVMEGHNDQTGVLYGICKACGDIDRKLAGGSGSDPKPLTNTSGRRARSGTTSTKSQDSAEPMLSSKTTTSSKPSVERSSAPPTSSASAPPTSSATQSSNSRQRYAAPELRTPQTIAELPHPPPRPGIVLVLGNGQLAWSTLDSWRVVDGSVPPLS
jgi:hypothetical protein